MSIATHHVVDIDAPAMNVWAALTEAHGLTSWWSTRLNMSSAKVGAQQHCLFGPPCKMSFRILQ